MQEDCLERSYDIFEILSDGSPLWRATVAGHENAIRKLQELALQTPNEMRVMYLPDQAIIATINVRTA
jgi:hypothetical protein